MLLVGTEGEELDPAVASAAARRERVVIQEVRDSLIDNTLIELVSPGQATVDGVRSEIQAAGHAGLSSANVMQLGTDLDVAFVITGLIDEEGREANLVAQETTDGTYVYECTLHDWPVLVGDEAGEGAG